MDDKISCGNDVEVMHQSLLEYQQCQMECMDSASEDCVLFEDTVPIHDVCLSSSRYCARGSLDNSF